MVLYCFQNSPWIFRSVRGQYSGVVQLGHWSASALVGAALGVTLCLRRVFSTAYVVKLQKKDHCTAHLMAYRGK